MPTIHPSIDWCYLSTLTPEQLAEHLPMQRGLNELDTNCSLTWSKVTTSGFKLHCSFATNKGSKLLAVSGRMQPHEGKTLIVITPPRTTVFWAMAAGSYVLITLGMMWAVIPIVDKYPIILLLMPVYWLVLLGGFSLFYLRHWRMHCRTVEASLCRLLQAERVRRM